ncbi:MepB family protein [Terribacillus saccharophilus]|nr:MepB family protein [Terribacillus goriensis]
MLKSQMLIEKIVSTLDNSILTKVFEENQNIDYEGMLIHIENNTYRSRLAKATPKKRGYFVAFWEKDENNKNQPYSFSDSPDKIIISIIDNDLKGQFIFPKSKLLEKGILSSDTAKGKMAIRVYPSWEMELNKTAEQTQKWQQSFFVDLTTNLNQERLEELYFH